MPGHVPVLLLGSDYFLEKKDIILPWFPLGPLFLAFEACEGGAEFTAVFSFVAGGGASSSEKDSHAGSWIVTVLQN